jgi:hypothetical protein
MFFLVCASLLAALPVAPERAVSFAPILGYDPIPGPVVGAAFFSAPVGDQGTEIMAQIIAAPKQPRGDLALDVSWKELWPGWTPRISLRFHSFETEYFGLGMAPDGTQPLMMKAYTSKTRFGLVRTLAPTLKAAVDGFLYVRSQESATDLDALVAGEGPVEGAWAGVQLEAVWDTRERTWGDAEGVRVRGWLREWPIQGSRALSRLLGGAEASAYVRLDSFLLLALHGEAATSRGNRGVLSTLHLGGSDNLRGYVSERFRGDSLVLGQAELRTSPLDHVSVVGFAEAGRVWLQDGDTSGRIASDVGVGVRWDIPPGRRARVRADAGWSSERMALFVTFGDAF